MAGGSRRFEFQTLESLAADGQRAGQKDKGMGESGWEETEGEMIAELSRTLLGSSKKKGKPKKPIKTNQNQPKTKKT